MGRTKRSVQTEEYIELTKEALEKLKEELENRKTVLREEIAAEISTARELGDLRENQAYTYAMEKKERNELRISELEDMLKRIKVISGNGNSKVVQIGSKVTIKNLETKKSITVTLVGSEETQSANPNSGDISIDSPIGRALYNSKVGEEVTVSLPAKDVKYKIEKLAA